MPPVTRADMMVKAWNAHAQLLIDRTNGGAFQPDIECCAAIISGLPSLAGPTGV